MTNDLFSLYFHEDISGTTRTTDSTRTMSVESHLPNQTVSYGLEAKSLPKLFVVGVSNKMKIQIDGMADKEGSRYQPLLMHVVEMLFTRPDLKFNKSVKLPNLELSAIQKNLKYRAWIRPLLNQENPTIVVYISNSKGKLPLEARQWLKTSPNSTFIVNTIKETLQ